MSEALSQLWDLHVRWSLDLVSLLPMCGRLDCPALVFETPEELGDILCPLDASSRSESPEMVGGDGTDLMVQEAGDGINLVELVCSELSESEGEEVLDGDGSFGRGGGHGGVSV